MVYSGFIAFAVGGLLMMLMPGGRFRRLLAKSGLILLFLLSMPMEARCGKAAGIPRETADSLARRQVIYNGSYVTFNTLARDVLTKVSGKPSYRGLTAEQVLVSFRLYPDLWKDIPLIRIKDKALANSLGLTGKYASLSNLFDKEGNYRITPLLEKEGGRNVAELDEKAGILLTLLSGQLIEPLPADAEPLPEWRVSLELLYNRLPLSTLLFIILFCGALLFLSAGLFGKRKEIVLTIGKVALCSAFSVGLSEFSLQWILAGRLPVSNTFETLEFAVVIALAVISAGLRRIADPESRRIVVGGGMLMCGALALVAHLVEMNPVVTPLMPVLHSPWLSIHVSVIMTAYSLLLLTAVNSVSALVRPSDSVELRRLSTLLLYPGVWLLGLGIATGSIWAAISWGRYWSWDPKETWALITLLVYALPFHQRVFKKRRHKGNRAFHLYLLLAILTVAMTYFGVNFLNSRHAY
ncbi:MAG: cytochrome c biogenesis protein CcsA [Muribaculaceae bacterium]|nr:cytochrome c biogenesis protein CcsA [Muribaculaceae bacterium]